jgi:hypothetical protein
MKLELDRKGPFRVAMPDERRKFRPPTGSGVYLWCVSPHPVYRVTYVGQSGNLWDRMYEHISSILGDAY